MTALGLTRALVLTTAEQAAQGETLRDELGAAALGLFSRAAMHTPIEITEAALGAVQGADCLVAIGGGSTIGLAKAIALRTFDATITGYPSRPAHSTVSPLFAATRIGGWGRCTGRGASAMAFEGHERLLQQPKRC